MSETHSTNFVSSSEPPISEIVKPVEVTPPRKIRVDLKEFKPRTPNPPKDKLHDKPVRVCHFCGKIGHIHPNCFKLQAENSIFVFETHSTNFISSSEPPISEIVKPVELTPPKKIRVDLKEFKPKTPNPPKDKLHDRPVWVCHFCGKIGDIHPNCFKLQTAKRANKPKVPVPQVQDPMVLIGELVKVLNLYTNPRVAHHCNKNNNSYARVASKNFWIQRAQSN